MFLHCTKKIDLFTAFYKPKIAFNRKKHGRTCEIIKLNMGKGHGPLYSPDYPRPRSLISTNITDMTEPICFLEKWSLALPAFWRVAFESNQ